MELERINNKILGLEKALEITKTWKNEGRKLVFTNGCFDIIHRGHIDYLSKAKDLGDKLIIGLNSDISVRGLKGKTRPIQDEDSRATILAAFQFVDLVVLFDEDTPYNLIKAIIPNILVKGSDYKPEDIAGFDVLQATGGEVLTLDFLEGYSTSNIENKILKDYKSQ